MNKFSSRTRNAPKKSRGQVFASILPLLAAGVFASGLWYFMPPAPSTQSNGRVFNEGIRVRIDRSSPAFAALEDALLDENLTRLETSASNESTMVELLSAGIESVEPLIERITRDNVREANLLAQARMAREAAAKAMGQALFASAQEAKSPPQDDPNPSDVELAPGEILITPDASKPIGRSRSIAQANGVGQDGSYQHPTQTISLTDLQMSREELAQAFLLPMAAADQDPRTVQRMMASMGDAASSREPWTFKEKSNGLGGLSPKQNKPSDEDDLVQQGFMPEQKFSQSTHLTRHQVTIAGNIEFADGVALTSSNDRVVVYREADGETQEKGAVWLREGRYEVFVEETEGALVAELLTHQGEVLGRGVYELEDLPPFPKQQYRVDRIALKIRPVPQGITGQVIAAATRERPSLPLASAQVEFHEIPLAAETLKDGKFDEPSLSEGSQVVLRASRLGHWKTTRFASTGSKTELPLITELSMKTVLTSAKAIGAEIPEGAGVVWGRVTKNGQPLAGAQVDLMTAERQVRPVYFNTQLVPDPSLSVTTANGLYALVPVMPGSHAVQVIAGGMLSEPVLFPVEQRALANVNIETSLNRKARLRVFDAFRTDWPLSAELSHPGSANVIPVSRETEIQLKFASGAEPLVIDADAGPGYERVRLALMRDRRSIYVPMVQTKWLEHIRGSLRLNNEPATGVVVGFIQGHGPFRAAMEMKRLSPGMKLVYFNSRGELTQNSYGEPGGGFVAFNVPEGFHTVAVQSSGTQKVFASTVLVEDKATSVLSHRLR